MGSLSEHPDTDAPRGELMAYANKWSVEPGEALRFMVSSSTPYRAHLERFGKPGDEGAPANTNGEYAPQLQTTHCGSFIFVGDHPTFGHLRSFTIQMWIFPTLAPAPAEQGLLARWSDKGAGFGLFIDFKGHLVLRVGTCDALTLHRPLAPRHWHHVVAAYDGSRGVGRLYQLDVSDLSASNRPVRSTRKLGKSNPGAIAGPLLIAAGECVQWSQGRPIVRGLYNGKIEQPALFSRAFGWRDLQSRSHLEDLLCAWTLGPSEPDPIVRDQSSNRLDGVAVNWPTRAVTGHAWTGDVLDFKEAPEQYAAMHFHEDDLEDARWEPSFEWAPPASQPSGVYAMRLVAGASEYYVPFVIRRARESRPARVLVLLPTMTYLAYATYRASSEPASDDYTRISDRPIEMAPEDQLLARHPELGVCLYDRHVDGSGCCYSSRLRPIPNMQPGYRWWLTGGPRHFSADLALVRWLEAQRIEYDVATDEDLHFGETELVDSYRVVVTGTHPEYCTGVMARALDCYVSGGGRLMYLGGNGFYWVTSVAPNHTHMIEVRRGWAGSRPWESQPGESYHSTTGEPGGQWRYRGRPPQRLVGVGFAAQGWGKAAGYRRCPDSFDKRASFIFEGIGRDEIIGDFGSILGGAAGDEIDRLDPELGTPPNALLLATSSGRHSDQYQMALEELFQTLPGQGGAVNPRVRADMTYFELPTGGAVFSVGSINWCGSLEHNQYQNNVSRITHNVLMRFLS